MAYVYRHIRLDKNIPFYIGIGSDETFKRACSFKNRNKHWHNIINKVPYKIEIIIENISWEEACKKEKEFINLYGRIDLKKGTLVNMTDGGDGLHNPSQEIRDKISKATKGRKATPEQLQKMSDSRRGHIMSESCKLKISIANKGCKKPEGFGENSSKRQKGTINWYAINKAKEKNTGSTQSKETIKKRVSKLIGRKNTEESKIKMRESAILLGKCRKVYCLNNGITYDSCSEASRQLKVNNVVYVCQGKLKQTKGFIFEYVEARVAELEGRVN